MKPAAPADPCILFEPLEGRALLSTPHFLHHQHHDHTLHHRAHLHRAHLHRVHHLHTQHSAHFLRTTVPKPLVLTAEQRTNWPSIRDSVLANRPRVHL
jgi:hypothetical protein